MGQVTPGRAKTKKGQHCTEKIGPPLGHDQIKNSVFFFKAEIAPGVANDPDSTEKFSW